MRSAASVAVVACAVVVSALPARAATPAAHPRAGYAAAVTIAVLPHGFTARPRAISQGASHMLFGLQWRTWGGGVAAATGKADRGAGAANTRIYKVAVQGFAVGRCDGHRVYTALWVKFPGEAFVERLDCGLSQYLGDAETPAPTPRDLAHCPAAGSLAPSSAGSAIMAAKPGAAFYTQAYPLTTSSMLGDRFLQACGPLVASNVWMVDEHPTSDGTCSACDSHIYIARTRRRTWRQFGWFAY